MTDNEKEPQARPGDADPSATPDSEWAPVADSTSSSTTGGASSTDQPSAHHASSDDAPTDHAPAYHAPTEQFAAAPTEPGPRAYSATDGGTRSFEQGTATTVIDPADPAGEPVLTSPVRRRRTAKIIGITAAALVLVLVIGAVASELILRKRVTDCLEQQFSSLTGVPTSVSLSKKPMLLQATGSEIPWVQVDTANDSGATRLHIRADRIDADGDKTTVGSLDGNGYVPFSRVVELGKQAVSYTHLTLPTE